MTIYLTIITTVLVATQIIRIVQNSISLHRYKKVTQAEINRLGKVEDEDIEMQKEAYRLIVEYLEDRRCAKNAR